MTPWTFLSTTIALGVGFALGCAIGLERQYRQRTAGLRTEALYRVHVICASGDAPRMRDLVSEELERHHYPICDIKTLAYTEEALELAAVLIPTRADPLELDHVVAHLERSDAVQSATWTVSTNTRAPLQLALEPALDRCTGRLAS